MPTQYCCWGVNCFYNDQGIPGWDNIQKYLHWSMNNLILEQKIILFLKNYILKIAFLTLKEFMFLHKLMQSLCSAEVIQDKHTLLDRTWLKNLYYKLLQFCTI